MSKWMGVLCTWWTEDESKLKPDEFGGLACPNCTAPVEPISEKYEAPFRAIDTINSALLESVNAPFTLPELKEWTRERCFPTLGAAAEQYTVYLEVRGAIISKYN